MADTFYPVVCVPDLMLEYRKPNGDVFWGRYDCQWTYSQLNYVFTGNQRSRDAWNVEQARLHKWHGIDDRVDVPPTPPPAAPPLRLAGTLPPATALQPGS